MSAAEMYAKDHNDACGDLYRVQQALEAVGDLALADGSLSERKGIRTLDMVKAESLRCLMQVLADRLEVALHTIEASATELQRLAKPA